MKLLFRKFAQHLSGFDGGPEPAATKKMPSGSKGEHAAFFDVNKKYGDKIR